MRIANRPRHKETSVFPALPEYRRIKMYAKMHQGGGLHDTRAKYTGGARPLRSSYLH